jgi:deoxycytidylate deaminase
MALTVLSCNGPAAVGTKSLIAEREKTHGSFDQNATTSQQLKAIFRAQSKYVELCPCHKEALDMIASKIGRVLSGQAGFADHWRDISGYATLAMDRCQDD